MKRPLPPPVRVPLRAPPTLTAGPKRPPPWHVRVPARAPTWTPWVHPAERGMQVCAGSDQLMAILKEMGHEVATAAHPRDRQRVPVPWTTPAGIEAAELLNLINRACKATYYTAAQHLRALLALPNSADVIAELRTLYRLDANPSALRTLIDAALKGETP